MGCSISSNVSLASTYNGIGDFRFLQYGAKAGPGVGDSGDGGDSTFKQLCI